MSDKLRDQEKPTVLGYELDRKTLTPIRRTVTERAPEPVKASEPAPATDDAGLPYGTRVSVIMRVGRHSETRLGSIYKTDPGSGGGLVYDVVFDGDDFPSRVPSSATVEVIA